MKELELIDAIKVVADSKPIKIIISNPTQDGKYKKILLEKLKDNYHISRYTATQVFNKNISSLDLDNELIQLFIGFKQLNAFINDSEIQIKLSKKNKVFLSKTKSNTNISTRDTQNIEKNRILKEGTIIPPLVDMGVFTKDGKISSQMYDKYKQINRFIEIIDDEIKNYNKKEITVVDFGCGKSYLTFILYYYLKFIKNLDVNMIGLDLKKDVIENCNKSAQKYGYDNLHFVVGDIKDYVPNGNVDMVISLHACDTATDYALYNAITWNAQMIFSVPCCQHEINNQIHTTNFPLITRYGITKERISAILTDNIRCNILGYFSYKVDLIEFISLDHTPKNLLIRATLDNISSGKRQTYLKECEDIMKEFSFSQKLYELIKK